MTRGPCVISFAAACLVLAGFSPAAAQTQNATISDAIGAGKLILEERLRYEDVDQAGFARDAQAVTLRTHLGWETGVWESLKGAVEFEDVRHLSTIHYNTTINGKTTYPTIADPDTTELDRLQLTWTPVQNAAVTAGRQRVVLDDQRFIGSANWRQDDQTFDAVRLDGSVGRFKGVYVYLNKINRTVAQAADWNSNSHAFTGVYAFSDALKAEGFVYALDLKPVPALSSETVGARITGQTWLSLYKIDYAASYADQHNYAANPGRYHLPYWMAEVAGTYDIVQAKLNYESLGSDGKRGFATPLATLHIFQGWADAFTTTPVRGVNDANLSVTISPRIKWDHAFNLQFFARHHEFSYATGGGSLGSEWDASAQANITAKLVGLLKYADYRGVTGSASRRKLWVQFDYNY